MTRLNILQNTKVSVHNACLLLRLVVLTPNLEFVPPQHAARELRLAFEHAVDRAAHVIPEGTADCWVDRQLRGIARAGPTNSVWKCRIGNLSKRGRQRQRREARKIFLRNLRVLLSISLLWLHCMFLFSLKLL